MNSNFKVALWTLMLIYGGAISFDGNGYVHATTNRSNSLLEELRFHYADKNVSKLNRIINEKYSLFKDIALNDQITGETLQQFIEILRYLEDNLISGKVIVTNILDILINRCIDVIRVRIDDIDESDDDSIKKAKIQEAKQLPAYKALSSNYLRSEKLLREKLTLHKRGVLGLVRIDNYSAMIASKHFNSIDDYVNLERTNKRFNGNMSKFHYSPLEAFKKEELKFFPNMQTLYLNSIEDIERFLDYVPDDDFINNLPEGHLKANKGKFERIEVHAPISYNDAKMYLGRLNEKLTEKRIGHVKFLNVTVDYCEDIGHVDEQTGEFVFNDDVYTGANKDKTYFIKTIDDTCFSTMDLVSITIPDSVKSIGDLAFSDCEKLASITIPNSVTLIGNDAFSYCPKLTSITIPNSVTFTPYDAFVGCRGLTSVTLSNNNVRSIDRKMFEDCIRLKSITIPDSVYSVDEMAFANCNSELEFHVPSENMKRYLVDNVGIREDKIIIDVPRSKYAWIWNVDANGILKIPNDITKLYNQMFEKRKEIRSVVMSNSVTHIGQNVFRLCEGLTSITIPDSVTKVERGAFEGCTMLAYITIPDSVCYVDEGAFANCNRELEFHVPSENMKRYLVDNVHIHENNIHVDVNRSPTNAWIWNVGADGILNIPDNITKLSARMFKERKDIRYVVIPDSVTNIESRSFAGCQLLASVTIPDSIQSIGTHAFDRCTALENIFVKCSDGKISNKKAAEIKKMIDKANGDSDKVRFIDANGEKIQPTDE